MSDKPKPCPWCGWHGERIDVCPGDTFRYMRATCPSCSASPGEVRVEEYRSAGGSIADSVLNYAAALEAWNLRYEPPKD